MNYYKEYDNIEIPTYRMPKTKKNTGVCQWSSTRPIKTTVNPKKLVVETSHKIASEQVSTTLAPNQNEMIHTTEENKITL